MEWPFLTSKLSLSRELGGCGKGTGLACGMSAEKGWEFIPSSCIPDISFRCTFDISKVWPRLWYNTFLILFPTFHEFSAKNWKKSFVISMPRLCYIVFFLHWFCSWLFMKFYKKLEEIFCGISMPRLWYNVFFLHWFCSWHFMKIHQNTGRNLICIPMARLWCNIFSLHRFCSWPFMKNQQKYWKKS